MKILLLYTLYLTGPGAPNNLLPGKLEGNEQLGLVNEVVRVNMPS